MGFFGELDFNLALFYFGDIVVLLLAEVYC